MEKKCEKINITKKFPFGHCKNYKHKNYLVMIGKTDWMICKECKIKWFIGIEWLTSLEDEIMEEKNIKLLEQLKYVPFP